MLRDDYIVEIQESLDKMYCDPNSRVRYDIIMNIANTSMNMNIVLDEEGKHSIYWFNRKCNSCFDDSLEQLVHIVRDLDP